MDGYGRALTGNRADPEGHSLPMETGYDSRNRLMDAIDE